MRKFLLLFLMIIPGLAGNAQISDKKDASTYFKALKWRSIGPFRGGRSVAVHGVNNDPLTYYMGTTGGGLWKTEDAGQIWNNISDGYFTTGSVGSVAVAGSDPNIVYCGMGEHAPRGVMTSHGDGMYRSDDAGKTWRKIGLEATQHISRIRIHPKNPDLVYVAAQGALYGRNPDRGIFRTSDGGKTWKKILFVDDRTGCSELYMDSQNPLVLYAAMWEHQRLPWKVISGGPGSALYKSTDGGDTWFKIHEGLPEEMGKMAIAACPSNPDRVYAVIESDSEKEKGGLFVSTNGGKNWSRVSDDHRLVQRAWYYIEVFPDPQDEFTVYVLSAPALRSIDGGQNWETLDGTHGDFHDLWINPQNPKNMVIGNDGGAAITFNRGETWSTQDNMPTAQFYRINVDNHKPYRIYGGQQDNTSVRIQSRNYAGSSITERDWTYSAGGESAFLAFDPDNPRYVLGGSYLGTIEVYDTEAGAGTNIMAAPIEYLGRETKDMRYRCNWNAPILWSQHEPHTYYHGAQYVLRTRNMGMSWEEISPDLSRNEKDKQGKGGGPFTNEAVGAENYGTISYMIESPHEKGVLWVGTDDGYVQLTRDGGTTWQNVTPKDLKECLINAIDISAHNPATAYIATTRYKFNDHTPALFKTTDYGKTWTNISKGIPMGAYTRVVREDPVRKGLLYCGTETGFYISWDDGMSWNPFQLNLPITPITDLMVKHDDLIAATSGRSYWILDELNVLRLYHADTATVKLYEPEPTLLVPGGSPLNGNSSNFKGSNSLTGVNPASGAVLYYHLPPFADSLNIQIEIRDAQGNLVRSYTSEKNNSFKPWDGGPPADPVLPKNKGLNRFVWDLRYPTMTGIPGVYIEASFRGHKVVPGTYQVTLKSPTGEVTVPCEVKPHPIEAPDSSTFLEYHQIMSLMEGKLDQMHKLVNQLNDLRKQVEDVLKRLPEGETYKSVREAGKNLIQKLKTWDEEMVQRKSKAYDDVENFENKFTANFMFLINQAEGDIPRINEPVKERYQELNAEWVQLQNRAGEFLNREIPALNQTLWNAGLGAVISLQDQGNKP